MKQDYRVLFAFYGRSLARSLFYGYPFQEFTRQRQQRVEID